MHALHGHLGDTTIHEEHPNHGMPHMGQTLKGCVFILALACCRISVDYLKYFCVAFDTLRLFRFALVSDGGHLYAWRRPKSYGFRFL